MPLDYRDAFLYAAWSIILVRIHSHGIARRYYPYVIYVAAAALTLTARTAAQWRWGIESREYPAVYFATDVVYNAGAILVLLWLHWLPRKPERRDWSLVALAAAVVGMEALSSPGSHILLRFSRGALFFRTLLGLKVLLRCFGTPSFKINRNLGTALLCAFVPTSLQALNETLYISRLWPYEPSLNFTALVHILAWGVAAWGMWDLDPPEKGD